MLDKENAIRTLEHAGWKISSPEKITVTFDGGDFLVMSQEGNGEWIVTVSGSVTFFEEEAKSELS